MPRATPKLKRLIESTGHFVMLVTHRRQQDAYGAKFLDSTEGASLERAFDRFAALEGSAGLLRTLPDPVVLLTDRAPPAGAPAGGARSVSRTTGSGRVRSSPADPSSAAKRSNARSRLAPSVLSRNFAP